MPALWHSSSRKLERAAKHFKDLHDELRGYVRDGNPFEYKGEIDEQESRFRVRIVGGRPAPPDISLMVGDFVQNLRASLDHLVCAAVEANGHTPTTWNAFPILTTPRQGNRRVEERWKRQIEGIADSALPLLDQIQPYKGGENARYDALAILQALSNEDKHRIVLQTLKAVPSPEDAPPDLRFEVEDIEEIESYELHAMKSLASGDILMETAISIIGQTPKIRLRGRLPIELAFGEARIPESGLVMMFDRVDVIVAHLSNQLFGADLGPQPLGVRIREEVFEPPDFPPASEAPSDTS